MKAALDYSTCNASAAETPRQGRLALLQTLAQGPIESLQQRGWTLIGNDDFIGPDLSVDAAGLGNRYQWTRWTLLFQKFCHLLYDVIGKRVAENGRTQTSALNRLNRFRPVAGRDHDKPPLAQDLGAVKREFPYSSKQQDLVVTGAGASPFLLVLATTTHSSGPLALAGGECPTDDGILLAQHVSGQWIVKDAAYTITERLSL